MIPVISSGSNYTGKWDDPTGTNCVYICPNDLGQNVVHRFSVDKKPYRIFVSKSPWQRNKKR